MSDPEKSLIEDCLEGVRDWENDSQEAHGLMNEWADAWRMKTKVKNKRPTGISKSITADLTSSVNVLAESITRMQTLQDPFFELRSTGASEEQLYQLEIKYQKQLLNMEFKRKLLKGNRGMCTFGTQVWEEPITSFPPGLPNPWYEGTDFIPLSLLQVAYRAGVYDINFSDFLATLNYFHGNYLRFSTSGGIWDHAKIEEGIKEKSQSTGSETKSKIEARRQSAGYAESPTPMNELILWHGRLEDYENPLIAEMWDKYGMTVDPRHHDVTVGILNRKRLVRLNPTPYGTWHHLYKIGHYMEFELEPIAYAVGALGYEIQKDINRITRKNHDIQTFDVYSMKFVGRGAGLKQTNLKVFPFNMIPVDDVDKIKDIRPNIDGMIHGLKLIDDRRRSMQEGTHASPTLKGEITGATAREVVLAQPNDMRGVSLISEVNADAIIRPHLLTMHKNEVDQNPYDENHIPEVDFIPKVTNDKDFRPEHITRLLEFATIVLSIRSNVPMEFNPMPILKQAARAVGINPRELKEPRSQMDQVIDAMRRINGDSRLKNEVAGEAAGAADPGGGISQQSGLSVVQ